MSMDSQLEGTEIFAGELIIVVFSKLHNMNVVNLTLYNYYITSLMKVNPRMTYFTATIMCVIAEIRKFHSERLFDSDTSVLSRCHEQIFK